MSTSNRLSSFSPRKALKPAYIAVSIVLAIFRAGSLYFYENMQPSLTMPQTILIGAARTVLYTLVFASLFVLVELALQHDCGRAFVQQPSHGGGWKPYLALALGWLPWLLIKYPAAMCWDSWLMLNQYRFSQLSAHQSVLYSLLLGGFTQLGESTGHANLGLFAFSFVHYAVYVAAFGRALNLLKRIGLRRGIRLAVLAMFLVNPYILGYIGVVIKDSLYTGSLMLFILCLLEVYVDAHDFAARPGSLLLMALAIFATVTIRKNGLYVLACGILACMLRSRKKQLPRRILAVMLASAALSFAAVQLLNTGFNATPGGIQEALSIPFQQTARYIRDYGDEVTPEEREAIDAVLEYDSMAKAYDPQISDDVKKTYRGDASKLPAYFSVWFRQFLKHPHCYVNATWEQNYSLFVPEKTNITLYQDIDIGYELDKKIIHPFHLMEPVYYPVNALKGLQEWVIQEFSLLYELPVVRLIGNVSIWLYALIILTAVAAVHRAGPRMALAPLWATVFFTVTGPVILGHPRYMFPVIYLMPVMICVFLKSFGLQKAPSSR